MDEKDIFNRMDSDKLGDISRMSKEELQKKMAQAIDNADKSRLGKMLSGLDTQKIKDKLSDVDPQTLTRLIDNIKGMDRSVLDRIKKALTGKGE